MKLSLIITTKNRARYFERALDALIREKREGYPNIEIVITDAGSTDGTVDIIRKNEAFIAKWISKPDSGVSEGFNRACALATGDVIWGTGDDDIIVPCASLKMMAYLKDNPEVDAVFGQSRLFVEQSDGSICLAPLVHKNSVGKITKKTISRFLYGELLSPENGFFRKHIFKKVNGYDLSYHYWAFWDFFFRLESAGARMCSISEIVVDRYNTPLSDTRRVPEKRAVNEHDAIAYKHGGVSLLLWRHFRGDISVANIAGTLLRNICSKTGFHPRKICRDLLSRLKK